MYGRRWLVLACVALLNNTNTMSWIAFAPVSNIVNIFYGNDTAEWCATKFHFNKNSLAFHLMNCQTVMSNTHDFQFKVILNVSCRFSLIYMICTIPVGCFAMWAGRRFGLRSSILIAGLWFSIFRVYCPAFRLPFAVCE